MAAVETDAALRRAYFFLIFSSFLMFFLFSFHFILIFSHKLLGEPFKKNDYLVFFSQEGGGRAAGLGALRGAGGGGRGRPADQGASEKNALFSE